MRGWLVARRDPGQITGHRAVHRERIEAVSTPNIAADVPDEVGRYGVQVDGGVAVRLRRWTTTAATDVVVAQNERVRLQQPDTEAARVQDVVVGDPHRQSTERLAKDSFGARGRDPVAAEAQGCCRPRRSVVDVDPVNATADRRGRDRDRRVGRTDSVNLARPDTASGNNEAEDRRCIRRCRPTDISRGRPRRR